MQAYGTALSATALPLVYRSLTPNPTVRSESSVRDVRYSKDSVHEPGKEDLAEVGGLVGASPIKFQWGFSARVIHMKPKIGCTAVMTVT